jgi:hypothetical protein
MTEGVAGLNDPLVSDGTDTHEDFGALHNGSGSGIASLAKVKADEVARRDRLLTRAVLIGQIAGLKIMV